MEDETRIGLMPISRRRITNKGVRPLISSEIKREYECESVVENFNNCLNPFSAFFAPLRENIFLTQRRRERRERI